MEASKSLKEGFDGEMKFLQQKCRRNIKPEHVLLFSQRHLRYLFSHAASKLTGQRRRKL